MNECIALNRTEPNWLSVSTTLCFTASRQLCRWGGRVWRSSWRYLVCDLLFIIHRDNSYRGSEKNVNTNKLHC